MTSSSQPGASGSSACSKRTRGKRLSGGKPCSVGIEITASPKPGSSGSSPSSERQTGKPSSGGKPCFVAIEWCLLLLSLSTSTRHRGRRSGDHRHDLGE